jgi:hypothetical protein
MRILTALFTATLCVASLAITACGDDSDEDAEPFATLQACYDDHHGDEGLSVQEAIVVCCINHPIKDVHPSCEDTQADCVAHVTAELDTSVPTAEIQAACTTYITEK